MGPALALAITLGVLVLGTASASTVAGTQKLLVPTRMTVVEASHSSRLHSGRNGTSTPHSTVTTRGRSKPGQGARAEERPSTSAAQPHSPAELASLPPKQPPSGEYTMSPIANVLHDVLSKMSALQNLAMMPAAPAPV